MTTSEQLRTLYLEWRRLSEAEGEAIRLNEWGAVDRCQSAKYQLQQGITLATETLQAELQEPGRDPTDFDRQFRGLVAELIQLEERNGRWLGDQMKQARARQDELNRTSRNLRQVQRAYATGDRVAAWGSYS